MKAITWTQALLATLTLAAANSPPAATPLFDTLGDYSRPVTTRSAEAQRYFDQGLRFLFGFNHGMAIRSFEEATRRDPNCAMAHWGVALACGPHINFPMVPPERAAQAWQSVTRARALTPSASPVVRALIEALGHRYANPQPEDRKGLDQAYADGMRKVWHEFGTDSDVGTLFAEALMDLRPWDQWTRDGRPQPGTEEVIATLDTVLASNPRHPLANHLYIHALEASPHPERAMAAADRLRDLQPGLAHNRHMPSHIDIRVGDWHKAVLTNQRAIEADQAYRRVLGPPKDLVVLYAAHNRHMLAYAAMMTGQSRLAMDHIRIMVQEMPEDVVREHAVLLDAFAAVPYEVMIRFGLWDEVLAEPDPYPEHMHFTKAFRHAARAVALAARGDSQAARTEQARYARLKGKVPAETKVGNNTAEAVFAVVDPMVEGEILVREAKVDDGLAALRRAVAAEDELKYDEPPAWMLPVRHALGANLMTHGRYREAEDVYREDLKRLPSNGWSLYGLADALAKQGKQAEHDSVRARFSEIWGKADLAIRSSCFCQPGA